MPIFNNEDVPIVERMKSFVSHYMDIAMKTPEVDLFMLNEFNTNATFFKDIFEISQSTDLPKIFLPAIQKAVEKGEISGNPKQIFLTLVSLSIFPFAGMAMIKTLMDYSDEEFIALMQERKQYLLNFLETAFSK